ncbi:MAG TPA: tyrosine-type recombinase/integrase [Solirubrobacteraceae bacterium]
MRSLTLGQVVYAFLVDHLQVAKGLRPSSIASYRDGLRIFLRFVAADIGARITALPLSALTTERVLKFLRSLEDSRHNHIRTRNQRLAMLRTFFGYLGGRVPELLVVAEQVVRISAKRVAPPETHYLDRTEIENLFAGLPSNAAVARDRTLLLFLYNTGARVQEVADLRVGHLSLDRQLWVRLHGKGDKWRTCPIWKETAEHLRRLIERPTGLAGPEEAVFCSPRGTALTRFGLYKIVRRHASRLDAAPGRRGRRVTPHTFRHTAAVHLLEAGVEVNVIRGWLGHVSLETTNRYAEISLRIKAAALDTTTSPVRGSDRGGRKQPWHTDAALMSWLDTL